MTAPFKDPKFFTLYNRYAKILSRIKAKQSRNERPSIRDDIFMSRLIQHGSLVNMAKFDFEHNDFAQFTKEKKPKKPKRERKLMYIPSFSDSLITAYPQKPILPKMQEPIEQKQGLLYGKFNSENAEHGILHKDGTFTILPKEKRERPLYDF